MNERALRLPPPPPPPPPLAFNLDLSYACNYRCVYCYWEQGKLWSSMPRAHPVQPAARWIEAWTRIRALYGEALINIVGGEPFLYPELRGLLGGLAPLHRLHVTTNVSLPAERLLATLVETPPDRLDIIASVHPGYRSPSQLLAAVEPLRRRGHRVNAAVVAYPPHLPFLSVWKELFAREGVALSVLVFRGTHGGRAYPSGYTDRERSLLSQFLTPLGREYWMNERSPAGAPCASGRAFASLAADGTVFRCSPAQAMGLHMGNIFDPGFRLAQGPAPCPAAACACGQYNYLLRHFQAPSGPLDPLSAGKGGG